MLQVNPLGRNFDDLDTEKNYDIDPYYGCSCSVAGSTYTYTSALNSRKSGDCMCQCSYGEANYSANYSNGYNK